MKSEVRNLKTGALHHSSHYFSPPYLGDGATQRGVTVTDNSTPRFQSQKVWPRPENLFYMKLLGAGKPWRTTSTGSYCWNANDPSGSPARQAERSARLWDYADASRSLIEAGLKMNGWEMSNPHMYSVLYAMPFTYGDHTGTRR